MRQTKILIICSQEIIYERNDGGKKCSFRNYELFRQVFGKENVYLLMFTNCKHQNEENIYRITAYKTIFDRAVNILRGTLFTSASNEQRVIDFIKKNKIDIVVFERSMFGSMIRKIKKQGLNCKIWVFVHNIEKQYFENKVKHQSILFYLPYLKIRKSEKVTFENADYIMTLTNRDALLIKEIYGKDCNLMLPMTFYDVFDQNRVFKINSNQEIKELLYIGTMFPPNYDGMKWFVQNVMPRLEGYHLSIVGKNFESKRKELERKNVSVIGTVSALDKYYYSNNIMVMPIFYGDGMKIKTAEAMMYGKIIIATDEALEGYAVEGVKGIYRCNTVEEFLIEIENVSKYNKVGYCDEVRKLFLSKYCLNTQIGECKKKWSPLL